VYGEGPTETASGMFAEKADYTARDIRFTTRGNDVYAIVLGEPAGVTEITSLAKGRGGRPVRHVQLLGERARISYRQTDRALVIDVPKPLPSRHASVFKIALA